MITANEIFSDFDPRIALWCDDTRDTADIAVLANDIIENKISLVSVPSSIVSFIWTYLEKSKVKIFSRHYFETLNKNFDKDVSNLSEKIMADYKNGAHGIQLFIKIRDFDRLVNLLTVIRDDLFFEHDLCLVLDVEDLGVDNIDLIFRKLKDIRANAFGIRLSEDMGVRSDFIGRIYGILDKWDFDGDLHFMLKNNFERIDQSIRLIESLRPELVNRVHFFLEN